MYSSFAAEASRGPAHSRPTPLASAADDLARVAAGRSAGLRSSLPISNAVMSVGDASDDELFACNEADVAALRKAKPWANNPYFFHSCSVSALAAMKMLRHTITGLVPVPNANINASADNSTGSTGTSDAAPSADSASGPTGPVEVMGLLLGFPRADGTVVVTDAFPLPVRGIEYRVEAAEQALAIATKLQDSVEARRVERFVGWYHSHPFPLAPYSHCHLSATDVSTQANWQLMAPAWTAIVVDPQRALATASLELAAFRTLPATFAPDADRAPDGALIEDKRAHTRRWGLSAGRYYCLPVNFFASSLGARALGELSRSSLWAQALQQQQQQQQAQAQVMQQFAASSAPATAARAAAAVAEAAARAAAAGDAADAAVAAVGEAEHKFMTKRSIDGAYDEGYNIGGGGGGAAAAVNNLADRSRQLSVKHAAAAASAATAAERARDVSVAAGAAAGTACCDAAASLMRLVALTVTRGQREDDDGGCHGHGSGACAGVASGASAMQDNFD